MKKEVVVLVAVAVVFSLFTLFQGIFLFKIPLIGHAIEGVLSLSIEGERIQIIIHSPLNATYNFAIGSDYLIDLNVSTPFEGPLEWTYKLEDLRHNTVVNQSVEFTPNATFAAVRWTNKLTVFANGSNNVTGSANVIFEVVVPNSAPLLGNISSQLYACEDESFSYEFNATDPDEDNLQLSVSPTTPFFVFPSSFSGLTFVESQLFSGILQKSNVGNHSRTVSVTDGTLSDSKQTNITVIEINNIPVVENIGVQTLYLQGEGSILNETIDVEDVEEGEENSGNFTFNISFNGGPFLFNISQGGLLFFDPNETHLGVHNITYCVADSPISFIHPNISLCSVGGESHTVCNNFSLTVTDENRAPTIVTFSPESTQVNISGTETLNFEITNFDPDGTIPDVYWYVDGSILSYQQGNLSSSFSHTYPCGVSGNRNIEVEITDGLLNDSTQWNITLSETACPVVVPSAGGGGGGGGPSCQQQWACNDWTVCQNNERSLELGAISGDDYREIVEACAANGLDESKCGFQTRSCYDNAYCNLSFRVPPSIQFCDYTISPSCLDGIKNCHDGTCELLVDCGGPCETCASCSDGRQNQGELGIDCGGPCPFACPVETPFLGISFWRTILLWLFWLILLILLLLLIQRIIKLIRVHNELKRERRIQSALSR